MAPFGIGAAIALAVGLLFGATVMTCLRFRAWLIPVVLLADFIVGSTFSPVAFVLWKLCFFAAAIRLDPMRGLFRLPRWPRGHLRGRGGKRKREFTEPMPWFRGPGTY